MAKNNNAPSTEGATSKEVLEKEVAAAEVVETTTEENAAVETTTEENAAVETTVEETATVETTVEETATVETTSEVSEVFAVNDKKYMLSNRCPEKLQFNGVVYSRKELLTNDEILQSLVIGESPFVKKV